jgi:hypothetical protein
VPSPEFPARRWREAGGRQAAAAVEFAEFPQQQFDRGGDGEEPWVNSR